MNQLKYDDNFKEIIKDIPYWKKVEDIPSTILEWIKNSLGLKFIFDTDSGDFLCSECTKPLDEKNYCEFCDIHYQEAVENFYSIDIDGIKETNRFDTSYISYVFDIIDGSVYLYIIETIVDYYHNGYIDKCYKEYQYNIDKVYYIEKDLIRELTANTTFSLDFYYKEYYINYYDNEINGNLEEGICVDTGKVYIDNLEDLKNTIYRYSYLWNAKEYLKDKIIGIKHLIFLPLYFPQFEYFMKNKMFSLAFYSPNIFRKNQTFQELFGVNKKYIPFIGANDMTYDEVRVLKEYPTEDISLIRFFTGENFYSIPKIVRCIKEFKIDLKILKQYLEDKKLKQNINEYFDYLTMASQVGLDMKDKKTLYPKNLLEEHDRVYLEMKIVNDPSIDEKIRNLATMLMINRYEDNKYVIYPASSLEELIKESSEQHNCVRGYCERVASNECQIYFMREKSAIDKSYVTIEVFDNTVVQARVKYNEQPNEEVKSILKKWEKNLIPVIDKENE